MGRYARNAWIGGENGTQAPAKTGVEGAVGATEAASPIIDLPDLARGDFAG